MKKFTEISPDWLRRMIILLRLENRALQEKPYRLEMEFTATVMTSKEHKDV